MAKSEPEATSYRVYLTVINAMAIVLTLYRVSHRYRARRISYDDYWVMVALFFDILYLAVIWIPVDPQDHHPLRGDASATVHFVESQLFTFTLWSARVSIICSIIRILHPRSKERRFSIGVAILFILTWIGLFIQRFWICGVLWRPSAPCRSLWVTGISQLSTDVVADVLLVGIPIYLLYNMRLPKNERILFLSIFSTGVMVTAASILHNVYIFRHDVNMLVLTANLEAAISLIVCNLLVVVSRIYCFVRNGEEIETQSDTRTASPAPVPPDLTRVTNEAHTTTISLTEAFGPRALGTMDTFNTQTRGDSTVDCVPSPSTAERGSHTVP